MLKGPSQPVCIAAVCYCYYYPGDLTSCLLYATFERYSVDTEMYDTRSKHIEGAKGIKT